MRKKMDKNKFINDLMRLCYLIFMRIVITRLIIAFVSILIVSGIIWADDTQVKIGVGVLANRGAEKCIAQWGPTAEYLNTKIPEYSFKIVPLPYEKVFSAVECEEVDFILINPSLYAELEVKYGVSRLLTLKNLRGKDVIKLYGGVILCRAERDDIRELNDIKGKSFMACDQLSLGGWQAAWRELKDQDIDPYRYFAELLFGTTHDAIVYAVQDGKVDAGSIRTGILENMVAEGKIDLATFRILNQRKTEGFPFIHSTRLYPEWPFAKIKSTADELAEKVAIALLQMPEDCAAAKAARCAGWTIPLDYQPVLECLKELRIGPYREYGKITLSNVIKQYWYWIVIVFALLILVTFRTLFVLRLNRSLKQSKSDLKKELSERKRAEEKTERLNRVLHAIRNINQLIARGKSRHRLLQGVCDILAETRFYFNIWIALFDKSGKLLTSASRGVGENFLTIVEQLKHGDLPECGRKALKESKVVVTEDPASTCTDCPLSKDYANRGAMTVRLGYEEKIYGLLYISSTPEISKNKEEQRLIKEVADDIAFGLHSIELEERRKRGEEELRESEEKYRNLFESSLDGIISTDMQGNILDINPAYMDMLGFSKEEIKKLTFQQLTPEKWLKNDEDIIKNQIIPRGYSDEYEKENIKKDGSVFPISIRVWLIKDENGKPVGMWRFVRDITKLKQMQERLVRQEKLAILGQLAGGVAHELRNPLGAIKNAAYFLNMVMEKPEPEVKESLQILEQEVGTSERIISSLLEFARPKAPTRRKIDINSVIQETLSRVHVPQNINVVNQLENTLPIILADPDQLKQVFTNIILNAIQSMPEGGDLLVRSEVESPEWMTVSFTDSGIGIPKDSLPKIFEPLFTTKAKGIGLGLAVTKTLIEGQGGTIQAQSEVGKGSTFAVKMPISKKEEE
jgi:PAS domain S-box-containing protein